MTATASEIQRPVLWTAGDWNAFFGFGTNILVNMLVLTGLLRFVLKMPDSLVFGRILPALGLMMCLSTLYYAFLAYRLALKSGRSDVCALPSGVSVPHMFIVTFVIGSESEKRVPVACRPQHRALYLGCGRRHHLLLSIRDFQSSRRAFARREPRKGEAGHPDLGTAEVHDDPRLATSGFMAETQNVKPKPA